MMTNAQDGEEVDATTGNGEDGNQQCNPKRASCDVVTTIRIAPVPPAASNCRTRRKRPQRLKIPERADQDGPNDSAEGRTSANAYEPDVESFVSGCIPGVSFGVGANEDGGEGMPIAARAKPVRKRPLPPMAYLASTQLAAAERKRRNEELERRQLVAEEEARKALSLNPIEETTGESGNEENAEGVAGRYIQETAAAGEKATPLVTTTREKTSNILMPPLLREYLENLERPPSSKSG